MLPREHPSADEEHHQSGRGLFDRVADGDP
jgi:hypothetical protein